MKALRPALFLTVCLLSACAATQVGTGTASEGTVLSAAATAGGPSPHVAPPPVASASIRRPADLVPDIERRTMVLANHRRQDAGLERLAARLDLIELARKHALDMAERGYFAHYSPEGAGPADRAHHAELRFAAFAENLARVRNSDDPAALAVRGWLESPGHRRNLLDLSGAGYRYTGVGVARAEDGSLYLVQLFLRAPRR